MRFLLVNTWIKDFAAFNLWVRPLGFLELAAFLRDQGHTVDYIDPRFISQEDSWEHMIPPADDRGYGQGRFRQEVCHKPEALSHINRKYRKYGMSAKMLLAKLEDTPEPDIILVSSCMTYWYPGVQQTIEVIKEEMIDIPILLGGIYATLCPEHAAEHSGADHIMQGPWQTSLLPWLKEKQGLDMTGEDTSFNSLPFAANDLYDSSNVAVTRFSRGCPYSCSYCASSILDPGFEQRTPQRVLAELEWNISAGRIHTALYDDALLAQADKLLIPVLKGVIEKGWECTFHTPNGLHARYMTPEIAQLFYDANFMTVRLSFEALRGTAHEHSQDKADPDHLKNALDALAAAGYDKRNIGIYMLIGMPGQKDEDIMATADFIHQAGGRISTTQYSPIPGTPLFERDCELIPGLAEEPLLQNNTIAPGWNNDIDRQDKIKHYCKNLNDKLE